MIKDDGNKMARQAMILFFGVMIGMMILILTFVLPGKNPTSEEIWVLALSTVGAGFVFAVARLFIGAVFNK